MARTKNRKRNKWSALDALAEKRDLALADLIGAWVRRDGEVDKEVDALALAHVAAMFEAVKLTLREGSGA